MQGEKMVLDVLNRTNDSCGFVDVIIVDNEKKIQMLFLRTTQVLKAAFLGDKDDLKMACASLPKTISKALGITIRRINFQSKKHLTYATTIDETLAMLDYIMTRKGTRLQPNTGRVNTIKQVLHTLQHADEKIINTLTLSEHPSTPSSGPLSTMVANCDLNTHSQKDSIVAEEIDEDSDTGKHTIKSNVHEVLQTTETMVNIPPFIYISQDDIQVCVCSFFKWHD